jgi:hypothetical protein
MMRETKNQKREMRRRIEQNKNRKREREFFFPVPCA